MLLATMMRMASFCGRGTLVVTPELAALGETFSPAPFLHYPSPLPPLLPPRVPDPFLRFLLLLPLLLLRLFHSCSAHSAAAVRISSTITTAASPVYLPSSFSSFSFPPSPFIFNTVSFILPLPSFSFHHFRHSFLFGVLLLFVFFFFLSSPHYLLLHPHHHHFLLLFLFFYSFSLSNLILRFNPSR